MTIFKNEGLSSGMRRIFISLIGSSCIISGCATPGKDTAIGAGAGAAGGAVIGAIAGGGEGAAIGAVAGGAIGGAIGNSLDKQAQKLAKVAETRRTASGIVVQLKNDLLFDTGSSKLRPDAADQLSRLGDILKEYPDDRIQVEGFTDNVGGTKFNELLSTQRAEAVRDVLLNRGVNYNQIMVAGLGNSQPIASNATSTGRAKNRRVELHIDMPQKTSTG